jgi:hypothetical protein
MSTELTPRTILNPDIAPQTMAGLLCLNDPDRGVVVCHPVPPGPRSSRLPLDVLHALGKRPKIGGWPGGRAAAERYANIWLEAEQISDLLLVRADLFAPTPLDELVSLARDAGTRTWLIFDDARCQRAAGQALNARYAEQLQLDRLAQTNTRRRRRTAASAKPWPTPSTWVARAAAVRTFTAEEFNAVDARMYGTFKAVSSYISAQRQLRQKPLGRFLDVVTSDPLARHRHARLLGASCALLQHGFASEINEQRAGKKTIVVSPTSEQAIDFRSHSSPTSAALHVLTSLTDLDHRTLEGITLDQIIETSNGVYLAGYLLQGAAAAALRAQHAYQHSRGFAPSQQLFTQTQLTRHRGPWGREDLTSSGVLEVKLAALPRSLSISFPQPRLDANCTAPARGTWTDAALLLRLLQLSPSRALALAHLTQPEQAAARRLTAARATRIYQGLVAASDHLRFSQFLADTANYVAGRTDPWP